MACTIRVSLRPLRSSSPTSPSTMRSRRSLKIVEGFAADPPTQEEVDRAKGRILKNIELALTNSQTVSIILGRSIGQGDWRALFLNRDEVMKVTPADVTRVAKAYLKSSNRTDRRVHSHRCPRPC